VTEIVQLADSIDCLDKIKIFGNFPLSLEVEICTHHPFAIGRSIESVINLLRQWAIEISG
jgi:hypothetical protein